MKDISVPTGYKSTDIGVIPEDWRANKLGDIAIVSSGGTPSRSNPSYWNGDIPWITTTQISFNTIFASDEFITKLGLNNSSAKLYDKNTLLMAMYGQGKTRGKVSILGIKATINQACASIQINQSNFNKYIFFYLSHQYEEIRKLSNTGNQENLNGNLIKNITLPLPPLPEQKAIARVLSDVDELIRECDTLLAKKRDIKQGTMQQLLTGKKRLPGFSGEWEEKVQKNFAQYINGRAYKRSEWEKNGIPVVRLQNLTGTGQKYYYSTLNLPEQQYMNSGDLIFMWSASFGPFIWKLGKAIYHYHIWKIEYNKSKIDKLFYFYKLHELTKIIKEQSDGSTMLHLTKNKMENYKLKLPPTLPEQKAIAEILSDMDAEIEALEQKQDKYKAIKQGMMQELLTGKTRLIS